MSTDELMGWLAWASVIPTVAYAISAIGRSVRLEWDKALDSMNMAGIYAALACICFYITQP